MANCTSPRKLIDTAQRDRPYVIALPFGLHHRRLLGAACVGYQHFACATSASSERVRQLLRSTIAHVNFTTG
ncbi:MAG: hypothetical protein QXP01_01520 [Candidatus Hadarchaeum sp.]